MGRLVISENVSLDGVMQDPTGEEGSRHGGWFNAITDSDRAAWAARGLDEAMSAAALLMGRRSDEYFATRWLAREGEWADRLNSMPKYVVSSTLRTPRWTNSTVLVGAVVDDVSRLKQRIDGDIVVIASRPLVRTLMGNDLVDELRLTVFPVVLGDGQRVFGDGGEKTSLRLVANSALGDGLVHLIYEVVR